MELSRSEYPGIVSSVHPTPAVKILRDRLQRVQTLNHEIADWLQERRRVEEAYAQGLNKLAKRVITGDGSDLGVFQGPWTRIASSTTSLATSHQEFAQRIEAEVERPLRDFTTRNSEWSEMKKMELTLAAAAKAVDQAEEKSEKVKRRGQKAKPQQVAEAANAVANASGEWESQAPFAFEKFQAADESRCNHLRDVLTTWQTLESDQAQRTMQAAEGTLNVILDINTSDEIRGFANKVTAGKQIERLRSRTGSSGGPPVPGMPSTPSIVTDDSVSVQSSGSGGGSGGGSSLGLKRLGTVLRGRNRNSTIPYFHSSSSPDKRPDSNGKGGPGRGPLGLMPPSPASPTNNGLSSGSENQSLAVPGAATPPRPSTGTSSPPIPTQNGESRPETATTLPETPQTPSATPSVTVTASEPQMDAEGYSIPPPVHEIGAGQIPDESADEQSQPQFKVEIKNDVIHEEEEEADAALSKVTSTLRAQNTVSRRTRGRRDASQVRNTMFIPNPADFEHPSSPPLTPIKYTPKSSTAASETASDTQSIRSSRSITSLTNSAMRHPELNELGLSASLIESVSMSFDNGVPSKTLITGEVAVAYNPHDTPTHPLTETLRIENFSLLEKVAPNPAFITAVPDRVAEYSLALANLHRTSIAFKYQVHVDEANVSVFAPIIVTPVWRIEPHQSSVIVHWKPNPLFRRLNNMTGAFTMKNVVFTAGIEGAPTSSCQSKPVGAFSRDRGRLIWKLGDVTINPEDVEGGAKKLVARFATEGLARSQPVEVRWEISGEDASHAGSGITISVKDKEKVVEAGPVAKDEEKETEDPFADAEVKSMVSTDVVVAGGDEWKGVVTVRKVVGGKYVAI